MPRMNGYQACRLLKTEPATARPAGRHPDQQGPGGRPLLGAGDGRRLLHHQGLRAAAHPGARQEHPGRRRRPARAPAPAEAQRTSVDILSRVNELLDRKLYEATILSEIGRVARSLVQFDETFTSVMALVARVVDFTRGRDGVRRGGRRSTSCSCSSGRRRPAVVEEAKARLLEAIAARARRARRSAACRPALFAPRGRHRAGRRRRRWAASPPSRS